MNHTIIQKAIKKNNKQIEDYCFGRDEKPRLVKNWQEFENSIKQTLEDKGYSWGAFHTADIELMLKIIEGQEKVIGEFRNMVQKIIDPQLISLYGKTQEQRIAISNYVRAWKSVLPVDLQSELDGVLR